MIQIKSRKRVKDLGEVFTHQREVEAMLNLLAVEVFENPLTTFLEPSCGTGNFLIEIIKRKINHNPDELSILKSLSSIYGVDISLENVLEARERIFSEVSFNLSEHSKEQARVIIETNIIQGDFLNEVIDFQEYKWESA